MTIRAMENPMTAPCELSSCACATERHGTSAIPGVGELLAAAAGVEGAGAEGEELAATAREVEEAGAEVKGTCEEIKLATG